MKAVFSKQNLRTVFANPKFHVGRVFKRGAVIAGISTLFFGWFPGVIPTLALSSLMEIIPGRRKVNVVV